MASDTAARAPEASAQKKGRRAIAMAPSLTEPSRPDTLNSKDQYDLKLQTQTYPNRFQSQYELPLPELEADVIC